MLPGSSTYFAPSISRARKRPFSTWQTLAPPRGRTSVGTGDGVAHAVQNERRHVYGGNDVADVDLERHAHERDRVARRHRHRLQSAEPLPQPLRVRVIREEIVRREALAPALGE